MIISILMHLYKVANKKRTWNEIICCFILKVFFSSICCSFYYLFTLIHGEVLKRLFTHWLLGWYRATEPNKIKRKFNKKISRTTFSNLSMLYDCYGKNVWQPILMFVCFFLQKKRISRSQQPNNFTFHAHSCYFIKYMRQHFLIHVDMFTRDCSRTYCCIAYKLLMSCEIGKSML